MTPAADRATFLVPESFEGPALRQVRALARYRIARLERELGASGAWCVELQRDLDGFTCKVARGDAEAVGHAAQPAHALDDAMSRFEVRLRLATAARTALRVAG